MAVALQRPSPLGLPSLASMCAATNLIVHTPMIPLGRPVKQLTKLRRKPVDEIITMERFDGKALPQ